MSEEWKDAGLCREIGGDIFFPEEGGVIKPAIAICSDCPVATLCLEYALENRIEFGVWGGVSAKTRRRMLAAKENHVHP